MLETCCVPWVSVLVTQPCPTLVTSWTVAHQAPLSRRFSRQEYWSGLPCPSPGDLPDPRIETRSPALQADSLLSEPPGKPVPWVDVNRLWLVLFCTLLKKKKIFFGLLVLVCSLALEFIWTSVLEYNFKFQRRTWTLKHFFISSTFGLGGDCIKLGFYGNAIIKKKSSHSLQGQDLEIWHKPFWSGVWELPLVSNGFVLVLIYNNSQLMVLFLELFKEVLN